MEEGSGYPLDCQRAQMEVVVDPLVEVADLAWVVHLLVGEVGLEQTKAAAPVALEVLIAELHYSR